MNVERRFDGFDANQKRNFKLWVSSKRIQANAFNSSIEVFGFSKYTNAQNAYI